MHMPGCGSEQYSTLTRARVQTHKSGVLPYPLWIFFAGTHWAWIQLPSLLVDNTLNNNHPPTSLTQLNNLNTLTCLTPKPSCYLPKQMES